MRVLRRNETAIRFRVAHFAHQHLCDISYTDMTPAERAQLLKIFNQLMCVHIRSVCVFEPMLRARVSYGRQLKIIKERGCL